MRRALLLQALGFRRFISIPTKIWVRGAFAPSAPLAPPVPTDLLLKHAVLAGLLLAQTSIFCFNLSLLKIEKYPSYGALWQAGF